MSESSDQHRTRRRSRRTAGPPGTEADTLGKDTTAGTEAGNVAPAGAGASGAGADGQRATDSGATEAEPVPVTAEPSEPASAGGAADPAGTAGPVHSPRRRSLGRVVASAAAAALVLALVSAAVLSVAAVRSADERDERRAEYMQAARQTVLNLTTIRADTAEADIDRIISTASGKFETEFEGRIDPFADIVKQASVESTGEVAEVAIERDDEDSARVLVAAMQTVTNAGEPEPQQRFYRFRVTMDRAEDGTMTASDVEFVA